MRLTQKAIPALKPGRYTDHQVKGLQVFVTRTGGRSFVQRLTVRGRRVDRGLGGCEWVTLAEAREIAQANRIAAKRGRDPFAERAVAATTFGDAAEKLLDSLSGKSFNTLKMYRSVLFGTLKTLTDRPVADVTRGEVIDVLKAVPSLASREKALKMVRRVLDLAVLHDWAQANVADNGGLAAVVGIEAGRAPTHHAAAPWADCPGIFKGLAGLGTAAADTLQWIMLTGARLNEAAGAEWHEIDLDARVWTVPAGRAKAKRDHRVPLSDAAVDVLQRRRGRNARLVFADRTGKVLSQAQVGRLAKPHTTHGYRSTLSDWMLERGAPLEVARAVIAHQANGNAADRAYMRTDHLERRRGLMDEWGRFLTGE